MPSRERTDRALSRRGRGRPGGGPPLNRTALQAEIDELAAFGRIVGLYGTSLQWQEIMGDWSPAGVVADWVAGQTLDAACGRRGFSGHPVWIVQELDTWDAVDSDWTC